MLKTCLNTKCSHLRLLFSIFFFIFSVTSHGQNNSVTIGSETVKDNAVLWLNGNGNQGLLLPSVANVGNITSPDAGMIVYQNSDNKIYYRNTSIWVEIGAGGSSGITYGLAYDTGTGEVSLVESGKDLSVIPGLTGDITGSLSSTKIAIGVVGTDEISNGSIALEDFSNMRLGNTDTGKILYWNGTTWETIALPNGTFTGVVTDVTLTGTGITGEPLSVAPINVDDADADPTNEIQNAAEVVVNTIPNLTSNNVQTALAEHQADIDNIAPLPATTDGQIIVSNGTTPTARSMGGNINIDNAGVTTIQTSAGDNITNAINNAGTLGTININRVKPPGGTDKGFLTTDGTTNTWSTTAVANRVFGTDQTNNLGGRIVVLSTSATLDNTGVRVAGTASDANLVSEAAVREAIDAGAGGWGVTGNTGTNSTTDFIGTTDAQPLRFGTGVGGVERMRVDASGNVGIGTTSPNAKLEVIGNVEIPGANSYTYSSAKTGYYSVSHAAFNIAATNTNVHVSRSVTGGVSTSLARTLGGSVTNVAYMVAGVNLPHGAVVTNFSMHFFTSGTDLSGALIRQPYDGPTLTEMATVSTAGDTNQVTVSTSTITDAMIDNSLYTYHIRFTTRENSPAHLGVYGARITYTVLNAD